MVKVEPYGTVEFVDAMGDDLSIIRAARVSYGRAPGDTFDEKKDGRLLRYLLKNGHWSPFEHTSLTFRVECPIFIARQWMRHRSWSFNEYSARYKEVEEKFYVPIMWRKQSTDNKQMSGGELDNEGQLTANWLAELALRESMKSYQDLLAMGVSREQARSVLPVGTFTEFYATASVRSVLHFLEQRLHPHAQHEIRALAQMVLDITEQHFPHTIAAWDSLRAGHGEPKVVVTIPEGNGSSILPPSTIEIQESFDFA